MRSFPLLAALASFVLAGCVHETYQQAPAPAATYAPAPYEPAPAPYVPASRPPDPTPHAPTPAWIDQVSLATGMGAPPFNVPQGQGRAMATRAARLDALRKLSEQVQGLELTSQTTVRDFVTERDEIRTRVDAYLQGARETGVRHNPDGTVEVDVEIPLRGVYELLQPHLQQ